MPQSTPSPPFSLLQEGWRELDHSGIIEAKNKIAQFESEEEWELRKKITNPYEAIFSGSETNQKTFPSLATIKPLSRSYFKMREMLQVFDFWATPSTPAHPFSSSHICEGPGGFLQCVVEGVKERKWPLGKLHAMTLKPTKSHIPGWRRSIHFLRKHPEVVLEYGEDGTGNVLERKNQLAFRAKGACSLFTADGGFDFSVDYSRQELHAFPLLLASFTMGLECLQPGGMMIIKVFDMYSLATQDLLLGSASYFDDFTIYKPATSRPCNSERYFIGRGYHGTAKSILWIQHLLAAAAAHAITPLTRLVGGEWPSEIRAAMREQILVQEREQIKMIDETLHFDKDSLEERVAIMLHESQTWCETFGV